MTDYRSCPGLDWQLDAESRELLRDGRKIRLTEKPFRVLMALVDARGDVVTREALQQRLWPDDTFVDFDNNLNSAVATLRQALGDSARAPRCIETLPRLGYRLVVPQATAGATFAVRRREPFSVSIAMLSAAAALAITVTATAFAMWPRPVPAARPASANPEAASHFARGLYLREQFQTAYERPAILGEARDAFRAASDADPSFAAAIAEEADTLVDMSFAGTFALPKALMEARGLAERAIDLDRNTAAAYRVLGMTDLFLNWNFPAADRHIGIAESLNPSEARTAMARATLASGLGEYDEAIAAARHAVTLRPESYFVRADLAFFYLAAGRNDEAAISSRDVLSVAPEFEPALIYSATANERLGRWVDAASAARRIMEASGAGTAELAVMDALPPEDAVRTWRRWDLDTAIARAVGRIDEFSLSLALKHAAVGELDHALTYLERAHARRDAWLVYLRCFPELEALRGHPRFERLGPARQNAS
jgi:DNA-binding winged helix-turn-helix (wHTH) protein